MSVVLVNGDGNPAVHASQDADLLGGIGGQETGILDINDKFAATIADANTVEISSGVCITKEGRRIQIDVGDVEEVTVPTGLQGTTKYYIIGFHLYTDGSGNQLAETFIDEVASPSATITEKMFKDGETEVYVSLYRITRNGLNLEGLTLILPEIGSLAGGGIIGNTDISGIADGTLTGAVAELSTDLSVRFDQSTNYIQVKSGGVWVNYKYFNPSAPYALIPTMTSNTTPEGIASATSHNSATEDAYNAFDGDDNTYWYGTLNTDTLKYEFAQPVKVSSYSMNVRTFNAQISFTIDVQTLDDSWHTIGTEASTSEASSQVFSKNVDFNDTIKAVRVIAAGGYWGSYYRHNIRSLQLYGYIA